MNEQYLTSISWPGNIQTDDSLIAMIYEGRQIPRMIQIAVLMWYQGKRYNRTNPNVVENFYVMAREYYKDAQNAISNFSARDFAILILCCNTYYKLHDYLPGTDITTQSLLEDALIFPYINGTYVVPAFL